MSLIRLYIDKDSMEQSLMRALRARSIDVLSVNETKAVGQSDQSQLRLAAKENRVLCSHNIADFCELHKIFLLRDESHSGIALLAQDYSVKYPLKAISGMVSEKLAESMRNQLVFLSQYLRLK